MSQATVFMSRVITGESKSITTGEIRPLTGDFVPYGGTTTWDVISNFLRTKLTPVLGVAINLRQGRNIVGEKVTMYDIPEETLVPLPVLDIYDAMVAEGVPVGAALGILGLFGVGMYGAPAALGIIMAAAPLGFAMYAARTAINAIGRPDADEYIEKQFQPIAVGRGLMNYIGALGLAPDMMDAFTAVAVPDDIKKEWGLQNRAGQSPTVGGIVPIVGYGDTWLRAANNLDNPHALVRALPFSNVPGIVPLVNLLRPEQ